MNTTDRIIIGSDEVLKGDTFGGIVVAAVKADAEIRKKLEVLGVKDSKQITDKKIILMAKHIELMTQHCVKNVYPEQYNAHKGNVTELLNLLHRECYLALKPGVHIVDKFPGCTVGDIIETQAESKYIEVAAASILARAHALRQFDELSKKAGFTVPLGSTHVKDALQKLKDLKLPLKNFVKLKFKNVKEFFNL